MCTHREHRTGNCLVCHPLEPTSPPEMPQLWEGDDS